MKLLLALAVLVLPSIADGQNPPSLDVFLDRLDTYAKQYQSTLPSLSCDEQIESTALNKKGKISWEMRIKSTLREIRTEDPYAPFDERREFREIDGRGPRKNFDTSQMPYFVEGGFGGMVGFKRWEERACFDYSLSSDDGGQTVRLEMTLKATSQRTSCVRLPKGLHRIVIADPSTGRIFHSQRTIAPDAVPRDAQVFFGEIDYIPQSFGAQTFWLPSRFYSHNAENTRRMIATYSNCHRYTGELKILPELAFPSKDVEQ